MLLFKEISHKGQGLTAVENFSTKMPVGGNV